MPIDMNFAVGVNSKGELFQRLPWRFKDGQLKFLPNLVDLSDRLPHYDRSAADHPEFYYNEKSRRYHYRDKGGFVSAEARENLTRAHIDRTREKLQNQTDRLNKISFTRWQKETFGQVKIAHTQSYMLGRGGIHKMEPQDYAVLTKEMRFQRDRFKLFAKQILDGKLSESAIRYRLTAYGEATKASHEDGLLGAAIAAGLDQERNVLGVAEHCPDCVKFTEMDWVKAGTLPRPTKKRRCMFNCRCRIEFRKSKARTDRDPREGLIKKEIINKQQEKQTVYVRPQDEAAFERHQQKKTDPDKKQQRSHLGEVSLHLAKQTFETEELPSREELLGFTKVAIADFMRDPIGATNAGIQREKAVREAFKAATGESLPSPGKLAFDALKAGSKKLAKAGVKWVKSAEGAVTIAGIAGSVAGGAVAGPAGALAGDLAGALVARKISEGVEAYRKGHQAIDSTEPLAAAKRIVKVKANYKTTIAALKESEMQMAIEKELVGDVSGWAIGNASGAAIAKLIPSPIPYGAGVAIATVPTVVVPAARKAHEYVRNGMEPSKAAQKAILEVFDGEGREKRARASVTKYIRTAKATAKAAGYALESAGAAGALL
jgi:hypothetical protein